MQQKISNNNSKSNSDLTDADFSLIRNLQKLILPANYPTPEGIEIGGIFLPSDFGGGDLFDIIRISDDMTALLLLTTHGNGFKPLLVSAGARICFSKHIRQGASPSSVIEHVNEELFNHTGAEIHCTAFVGYLDMHDNRLTYCNTGFSSAAVFRRRENRLDRLENANRPIGKYKSISLDEHYIHVKQGDYIIAFTDGLYHLFSGNETSKRRKIEASIKHCLSNSTISTLFSIINHHYASRDPSSRSLTKDISLLFAEILTQSRKNLIREHLGFKSTEKVYLQYLSYLEEMDKTIAIILGKMDSVGFKDEDIRKMKIVLTELLVNAIIHGNKKNYSKKVMIGHLVDSNKAVVSVMDEGSGFDPTIIPDPTLPENLEKPSGRGLFIVRNYVESIEFNQTGNRVTIVKKNLSV